MTAQLASIYEPVSEWLEHTEDIIHKSLLSNSERAVAHICQHILQGRNKRIRPALTLLTYLALVPDKPIPESVCKIAAAIELIHMASLIHDDIIDNADTRHAQPSVQAKFGQPRAITIGVFLYAVALELIAQVGNVPVLSVISRRVEDLCKGEIYQISERGNFSLNQHYYLDILDNKTAALFKAACVSGALMAGTSSSGTDGLEKFGYDLGMLFQLTDDFMDIVSTETTLGKHPGQDLFLEEMTLPVMMVFQAVSVDEKSALIKRIKDKDQTIFQDLRQLFFDKGLNREILNVLQSYRDSAIYDLKFLQESPAKDALVALVELVTARVVVLAAE